MIAYKRAKCKFGRGSALRCHELLACAMIESAMKRKIGLFIASLIMIGLVLGVIRLAGGTKQKDGALTVQSNQSASVFLDNKHIGRTPVSKFAVAPGSYTIRIVPESTVTPLASWQGNIRIASEILTHVNISPADSEFTTAVDTIWLEKISSKGSELDIVTNPDSATVSLDGETKGITPLSLASVPSGDHSLAIASRGFAGRNLKIKMSAGYKLSAIVKLALTGETQEASPSPTPVVGTPTPTGKTTPTPAAGKASPTPTKAAAADPTLPFVTIKDTPDIWKNNGLNVRMEPAKTATVAAQVQPGEKYHVEDEKTGWYQIKYDAKNLGWISGQYATKTE